MQTAARDGEACILESRRRFAVQSTFRQGYDSITNLVLKLYWYIFLLQQEVTCHAPSFNKGKYYLVKSRELVMKSLLLLAPQLSHAALTADTTSAGAAHALTPERQRHTDPRKFNRPSTDLEVL